MECKPRRAAAIHASRYGSRHSNAAHVGCSGAHLAATEVSHHCILLLLASGALGGAHSHLLLRRVVLSLPPFALRLRAPQRRNNAMRQGP